MVHHALLCLLHCTSLLHHERRLRSQLSMSQALCWQCWYSGTPHFSCCSIRYVSHYYVSYSMSSVDEAQRAVAWDEVRSHDDGAYYDAWPYPSDVTEGWRCELFNVVLTDSLDCQSCVIGAPWYLLWCRLRHCVDEDDDELRCPWRHDDVVSC